MKIRASDSVDFYPTQPTQQVPSTSAEPPGDNVPALSPPATLAPSPPHALKKNKLSAASFSDFNNRPAASGGLVTPDSLGTVPTASASTLRNASDRVSRNKLSAASFGDFSLHEEKSSAPEVSSISLRTSQQSQQDLGVPVAKALPPNGPVPYAAGNAASQYTSAATGGQKIPKWRFVCLSLSLCIGLFLSFLDGSITATALYTIGIEFNALTSITWIAVAYTLADVGFATLFTALADIIGRFNAYLLAQTIFLAFSFACGFAQSLTQLIVFRALQGIGGSGLYSLAMVIWPEMSTYELKKWIGAFVGLVVAAAGVAGPLVGGVITNDVSWRWIFWINPPIIVVSTALFVVAWPRSENVRQHEKKGFRSLDVHGAILLAAGCVLPVLAFQEVGSRANAWRQGLFIGPLVAGVGSWFLLFYREFRLTHGDDRVHPIFPPRLLANRRYAANAANSLLVGFLFFVAIYYVPLHMQTVNGKSPLGAGVALLPMLGSAAFGSFLAGTLSSGMDLLCPSMVSGSALITLGCGLLSTLSDSVRVETKIYGFQVLVGLGFGLTVSSSSILANVECELRDHAVAQGIVAQARVFGGSFGIAAGTAILGRKIRTHLVETGILAPSEVQSLYASADALSVTQLEAVRHTYANAFRETMIAAAIVGCAAFVSAIFVWNNSKIALPNRIVLQEQREDDRISKLMREKRLATQLNGQETGSIMPSPPYQRTEGQV